MVGVGWLVIMDDWLLRGGALGTVLGFVIGGAALLPIGWVYGKLVAAMPDAAGEIAYTSAVFSRRISFATGWMMTLTYFIVCPWEAVAVGRIAAYIIPQLDSFELYRIAGRPVFLPRLIIGLSLTALLTVLNYRGVRLSASFQNWTSFGTLGLFVIFVGVGVSRGSPQIFRLCSRTPRGCRFYWSRRSFLISWQDLNRSERLRRNPARSFALTVFSLLSGPRLSWPLFSMPLSSPQWRSLLPGIC